MTAGASEERSPSPTAAGARDRPRVLVLVGTRPEAIKMAPVLAALEARSGVETSFALTGQHTDLVDRVLGSFDLAPDHELGIMEPDQSLVGVASRCMEAVGSLLRRVRPRMVLVQGDTASVFFSGLVAFFEAVRVGHVEAGLRTGDPRSPFPEEMFRRLTADVADLHFAPTPDAVRSLRAEGIPEAAVHLTGNTVVDALEGLRATATEIRHPVVRAAAERDARLILLTAHRREAFGEPLRRIFRTVRRIADEHADVEVVYPVHPNPNVARPAEELLAGHPRIHLVPPLDYFDLLATLRRAELVLTDSGGIQEEAPSFGVPVLVLRPVTERPEGIRAGVARLVGTDERRILEEARRLLTEGNVGRRPSPRENPYGDGRAGERIADLVVSTLTGAPRRTADWKGP